MMICLLYSKGMNKKAMSIPIVLLVLLTLVLIVSSLFYFNVKQKDVKTFVSIPNGVDSVYVKEAQLDYYINKILNSINLFAGTPDVGVFTNNFRAELRRYKIEGEYVLEELEEVEKQVENARIENGKLIVSFDLELKKSSEKMDIVYNYKKEFEEEFEKDL